jgi:hypothetical protein
VKNRRKGLKITLISIGILLFVPVAIILYATIRDTYFSKPSYKGGYAPDGTFCDYGYKKATKECCDEVDYSCEMCDLHGKYCDYAGIYQGEE